MSIFITAETRPGWGDSTTTLSDKNTAYEIL